MKPDFRNVKGVKTLSLGLFRSHDLDINCPGWILTSLDRLVQVTGSVVGILALFSSRFFTGAEPFSPPTVEKRMKSSVRFPTLERNFAFVYFESSFLREYLLIIVVCLG
jgi:hypothetical protein